MCGAVSAFHCPKLLRYVGILHFPVDPAGDLPDTGHERVLATWPGLMEMTLTLLKHEGESHKDTIRGPLMTYEPRTKPK